LSPFALEAGLTDPEEIRRTIAAARRLLARFQAHPLYAELDRAERHHEVPYAVEMDGVPKNGIVDLLARSDDTWTLVEFKTDELRAGADLAAHIREKRYNEQVGEYITAMTRLLGERPRALLVFLNVGSRVAVLPVDTRTGSPRQGCQSYVGRRVAVLPVDTASECGKIQSLNFSS
jgi:ATP-dependent exoDNAse (exonuclease V) beta subunit